MGTGSDGVCAPEGQSMLVEKSGWMDRQMIRYAEVGG
jgi:hypothetical protein